MNISLSELSSSNVYHLMTQTIIPRPIAWVLSENSDSTLNLAPFSYFNAVSSDPPLCMLSMGKKPNAADKDTSVNLSVSKHCVIHIAPAPMANAVTATAATLEYGESEHIVNDIELTKHGDWHLPRIKQAPIAYFCQVHSRSEIGNTPQQLVFVEILQVYVDDQCVSHENNRLIVDALKVNPLARLGANQYADLKNVFSKNRPD